jgi:hypothetical protein
MSTVFKKTVDALDFIDVRRKVDLPRIPSPGTSLVNEISRIIGEKLFTTISLQKGKKSEADNEAR